MNTNSTSTSNTTPNTTTKLKLVFSPLNSLYTIRNCGISNYHDLFTTTSSLSSLVEKTNELLIIHTLNKTNPNNTDLESFVFSNTTLFPKMKSIDLKILTRLSSKYDIIVFNTKPEYLLIDRIILFKLGLDKLISSFVNEEDILSSNTNYPKSYLIFDYDIDVLEKYANLGCWTSLRCEIYYAFFEGGEKENNINNNNNNNKDSYVDWLIEKNKKYMENRINKNISSNSNPSNFIDFFSISIIQNEYYHDIIANEINANKINSNITANTDTKDTDNKANRSCLHKLLSSSIKTLILFRILPKKSDFKKIQFIISSCDLLYVAFTGGISIDLSVQYNSIDVVSPRITDHQDLSFYSKLYSNMESYNSMNHTNQKNILILNDTSNLINFLEREDMSKYLSNFCQISEIQTLNSTYNIKLEFPTYLYRKVKEDCMDYDNFLNQLKNNNIKLPIILKYRGADKKYNHLLTLIISNNGIKNIIEYFSSLEEQELSTLEIIIQQFNNHGGKFLKTFFLNHKASCNFRDSLPDVKEEYEKSIDFFSKGYFSFNTKDLHSTKYRENILSKFTTTDITNKVNQEYLNKTTEIFAKYSNKNLISIDFVCDVATSIYYILDCNFYPGYREMGGSVGEELAKHHVSYYKEYNNKK